MPVLKQDGSLRISSDYKLTINQVPNHDSYPLPSMDDLFAMLAGGQAFTELDLPQTYQQMILEDESKELLTINMHHRLFRYNRLPFGVSAAPSIFQMINNGEFASEHPSRMCVPRQFVGDRVH